MFEALLPIRQEIRKSNTRVIKLPKRFAFRHHDIHDFHKVLNIFDWEIRDCPVKIDLYECTNANYQAISLLVLYAWHLKSNGCTVEVLIDHDAENGSSVMWKKLGALGTFPILFEPNQQFKGDPLKPLFAVRGGNNQQDFKDVIAGIEKYTECFDINYTKTLRFIISELLYNTLEHGQKFSKKLDIFIPSIVQMCWYREKDEIHFIIADLGVGVREHLSQTYHGLSNDEEALKLAIQPEKSGTFASTDPYKGKNNAGMGLFLSSNIIRKLRGDMYLLSGNGLIHISPRDITSKELACKWPGTLALLTIRLGGENNDFDSILQNLRNDAENERKRNQNVEQNNEFVVHMSAYFGDYAEIKSEAINYRDKYLLPNLESGKKIILDFKNVKSAPHSFLNAFLATPIKVLGIEAYKRIKIINADSNIRETIDFIFEDNT
ncbi:DUF4325 domain-containing protein [Acinetobacter cumulans]|uniref:DUF4325 domain-containing protein n=2 Tax=Acinetobacter cumulans TaxID=2136182 RepID=A0A498CUW2_9GAMM|nr:DUF4325 domain-containing protein [Acinetobacter cumulans]